MTAPRWIDDESGFADLVDELAAAPIYALDTEFHRERTYYPHVALVQIAWGEQLAIVDPLAVDIAPLARVLEGDGLLVAHAADQDLEVLQRACGALPGNLVDTQVAAQFLGFSSPSLQSLMSQLLDVHLPKGDRLTNWTRRPLTADQLSYAASDVAQLVELWRLIEAKLADSGRLQWALDECRLLLERATGESDPRTAWWRMKDTRSLRGKSRGVAQAVAEWRELRARAQDLPPRFVLPDMAVAGIAHKPPASGGDLREIRGLEGKGLRGTVVDELLAAVQRGLALDPSDLVVPPADDVDRTLRPAIALVTAWIGQLAHDLQLDATMLATRGDVQALLRGTPGARLTRGWRAQLLAEPIRMLIDGEAALAFDGRGGLALERRSREVVAVALPEDDRG